MFYIYYWGDMELTFVDKNKSLVKKVKELFESVENKTSFTLDTYCWDVFEYKKKNTDFKICTASNPSFSMGGGLDWAIKKKYPEECNNLKEFVVTNNLFPLITVDSNIKTDRQIIRRCLAGIFAYRYKYNLILTGIGTAIGWLYENILLEELKRFLSADLSSANLISANLSSADLLSADLSSANLSYADLHSADLSYADLHSANLISANLSSADLRSANLSSANLSYADLHSADLRSANLISANLSYANLHSANLSYADLSSANLISADLSSANLHSANLNYADLLYANLSSANLSYANLHSANLSYANLSYAKIKDVNINELTINFMLNCPEEWDFIWRKKCRDNCIVKLLIPAKALRSSATTRKCRASYVKTLEIREGNWKKIKKAMSSYTMDVSYTVWKITKCDKREKDRWIECWWGIHFFLTREEAKQYI